VSILDKFDRSTECAYGLRRVDNLGGSIPLYRHLPCTEPVTTSWTRAPSRSKYPRPGHPCPESSRVLSEESRRIQLKLRLLGVADTLSITSHDFSLATEQITNGDFAL
jgi:hypothetical protein